jgi:hypothetical protein
MRKESTAAAQENVAAMQAAAATMPHHRDTVPIWFMAILHHRMWDQYALPGCR